MSVSTRTTRDSGRRDEERTASDDQLELVGHGPEATGSGPGGGWWMRPELCFRCGDCGGFVGSDPTVTEQCGCGALTKDGDAGRIGSRHGDASIAVYRRRAGGS